MPASTLTLPLSESQLKELETVKEAIKQGTLNGTIRQLIRERIQLQITLDHDKKLIAEQSEKLIHYERLFMQSYTLQNELTLVVRNIVGDDDESS